MKVFSSRANYYIVESPWVISSLWFLGTAWVRQVWLGSGLGWNACWIGAKCDGCHVEHELPSLQKQAWKSLDAIFALAEIYTYIYKFFNIREVEMKVSSPGEHSSLCLAVDNAALRLLVVCLAHRFAARPGSECQWHCTMCITPRPLTSGAWPGSPHAPSAPALPLGIVGGSRCVQVVKELQNLLQKSGISLDVASASTRA